MPTDIETALAAHDLDARVPRLVAAVVRWVPGGADLPTWTTLEAGAAALTLPPEAASAARERLAQDPLKRALFALEALDGGADMVSVLSGLGASLRLYLQKHEDGNRGGIGALDRRQRADAAMKVYTLAWCTGLIFGGGPAARLDALRSVPAGRALLAWVGAIELLLPFTEEVGAGDLRPLIVAERGPARERFARAYGEDAAVEADVAWEPLLDAALELGSAGTMVVGGITGVIGRYLPTVVSAVDFTGAVAAGAFDALPVYHLLSARLVAEGALVGPVKQPLIEESAATPDLPIEAPMDAAPEAVVPMIRPPADVGRAMASRLIAAPTFGSEPAAEPTFTADPVAAERARLEAYSAEPTFNSEISGQHPVPAIPEPAFRPPPELDEVTPSGRGAGMAAALGLAAGIGAVAVAASRGSDRDPADGDSPTPSPPPRSFVPTPTAPPAEPVVAKPAPPPLPPVSKAAPPPLPPPEPVAAKPAPPPLPPVVEPALPAEPIVAKPAPPPLPPVTKPSPPEPVVAKPAPPPLPPVAKPAPPPDPPVAKPVPLPRADPPKPVAAPKPPVAQPPRPSAPPPPKKSGGGLGWMLGGGLFLLLGCAGVGGGGLIYAGYAGMIDLSSIGIGSGKSSTPSTPTTRPTRKPGGRR